MIGMYENLTVNCACGAESPSLVVDPKRPLEEVIRRLNFTLFGIGWTWDAENWRCPKCSRQGSGE